MIPNHELIPKDEEVQKTWVCYAWLFLVSESLLRLSLLPEFQKTIHSSCKSSSKSHPFCEIFSDKSPYNPYLHSLIISSFLSFLPFHIQAVVEA